MPSFVLPLLPGQIELVSSIDEPNYAEVLEDFPNANFIFVTTFNISAQRDELLTLLREHADHADVRIISNIPARMSFYAPNAAGQRYRRGAEAGIASYMQRLEPDNDISTFFHLRNHSKVIMTNNIAYIGSGNFSDESRNNRETGFIIRDQTMIRQIINRLIPLMEGESTQYFGESVLEDKKNQLDSLSSKLESDVETARQQLFTHVGYLEDHEVYSLFTADLSLGTFKSITDSVEGISGIAEWLNETYGLQVAAARIDPGLIQQMKAILNSNSPLQKLANFNPTDIMFEYLHQNPFSMEEDYQYVVNMADEHRSELAEAAEESVLEFFDQLFPQVIESLVHIYGELERLLQAEDTIDNT